MPRRPIIAGLLGTIGLLALFAGIVSLISGWATTQSQFIKYWYYLLSLAIGFGVQIGMYVHLRDLLRRMMDKKLLITTGTTTTASMIACCAHYLSNIIPLAGVAGVSAVIGRYQVELFWVGLAANAIGIGLLRRRIVRVKGQVGNVTTAATRPVANEGLVNHATILSAFILAVGVTWYVTNTPASAAPKVQASATTSTDNSRTDTANNMTVKVTPSKLSGGSWSFAITIDNHVVSVNNDMVASSILTDAAGRTWAPKSWQGDPPGGHHRSGTLRFDGLSTPPRKLIIRDLGGVAIRTFTWDDLQS